MSETKIKKHYTVEPIYLNRFVFDGLEMFDIPEYIVKSYYDDSKNKILKITFNNTEAVPLLKLSHYFRDKKNIKKERLLTLCQLGNDGKTLYKIDYGFIWLKEFGDLSGDYTVDEQQTFDVYFDYDYRTIY